jgi:hypothetical protein
LYVYICTLSWYNPKKSCWLISHSCGKGRRSSLVAVQSFNFNGGISFKKHKEHPTIIYQLYVLIFFMVRFFLNKKYIETQGFLNAGTTPGIPGRLAHLSRCQMLEPCRLRGKATIQIGDVITIYLP